jgi:hypothetical protein
VRRAVCWSLLALAIGLESFRWWSRPVARIDNAEPDRPAAGDLHNRVRIRY